ncbi:MAG: hypothetical protein ACRD6X_19825 [Pyrinomonadaceae bacterium]
MKTYLVKLLGASSVFALSLIVFAQVAAFGQEEQKIENTTTEEDQLLHISRRSLEGVWDVQVTIRPVCDGPVVINGTAITVFSRGGIVHDTSAGNPALRTTGFGVWNHLRRDLFRFGFKFFNFDAAGNNTGFRVVKQEITLNPNGNEYTAIGTVENFDPAGNLLTSGCNSATATRFEP